MLDLTTDIDSLSEFKRHTPEFIKRLKAGGRPVVQDAASYQKLVEIAERVERMDALRASLEDMKAGRVSPAEEMLAEMGRILDAKKPR